MAAAAGGSAGICSCCCRCRRCWHRRRLSGCWRRRRHHPHLEACERPALGSLGWLRQHAQLVWRRHQQRVCWHLRQHRRHLAGTEADAHNALRHLSLWRLSGHLQHRQDRGAGGGRQVKVQQQLRLASCDCSSERRSYLAAVQGHAASQRQRQASCLFLTSSPARLQHSVSLCSGPCCCRCCCWLVLHKAGLALQLSSRC